MTTAYRNRLHALLSPNEATVFKKLSSPRLIQDYLEALPQNFPKAGEVMLSPRGVLSKNKAHCMEGALFAAAALAYNGQAPLLLDLQSIEVDEDHVVVLFKQNGCWGALSKTNHPVLRYRDPVYKSVRELAMSYFHEYFLGDGYGKRAGQKTMLAYSAKPFDLSRYAPERWVIAESIDWLADPLDEAPHSPVGSRLAVKALRKATAIERKVFEAIEWSRSGKKLL